MAQGRMAIALPWNDATGRLSWLKLAATVAVVLPGLWIGNEFFSGRWDFPSPYVPLIYHSGLWATAWLLAALAVTPLRQLSGYGRLAQLRRLLGLASFAYALLHLVAWFGLRFWDWGQLLRELLDRPSLWIATLSLVVLLALAATSFDGAMRAMGAGGWKRLHRLVYPAAILAVLHFLMSPGSLQGLPFLMAGLCFWLLVWRLLDRARLGARPLPVAALGLATIVVALLLQPLWIATFQAERAYQAPIDALADNFSPTLWAYLGVPPFAWLVVWGVLTTALAFRRRRRSITA